MPSTIVAGQQLGVAPYFRVVGHVNQHVDADHSLALLQFRSKEKSFSFVEKTGTLAPEDRSSRLRGRFAGVAAWPKEGNHKDHKPQDKDAFSAFFRDCSACYFPASRKEAPHWLNREAARDAAAFGDEKRYTGLLGKPILVESSSEQNKRWLLDVVLDSRPDIFLVDGQPQAKNLPNTLALGSSRKNVETLLGAVLCRENVELSVGHRGQLPRLSIAVEGRRTIPSLDNLSAGQAVLFNMFATIIRYADRANISRSICLADIEGIVLIDEIDSHLHVELQHKVLPKILQLFPKVQFLVSSHSPLFVLGMEHVYGEGGVTILEMPTGHQLGSERFSEFGRIYDCVRDTATFEADVVERAKQFKKPVLITEGRSDAKIVTAAWQKLHPSDNQPFEVVPSGIDADEGERTGNADDVRRMLEFLPTVTDQPVVRLFDNDREGNEKFKGLQEKAFEPWVQGCGKRKHLTRNVHGLLLPVPPFRKAFVTEDDICQRYLTIEHYFRDEILDLQSMKGARVLGSSVFQIRGDKMKFAEAAAMFDEAAFAELELLLKEVLEAMGLPASVVPETYSETQKTDPVIR